MTLLGNAKTQNAHTHAKVIGAPCCRLSAPAGKDSMSEANHSENEVISHSWGRCVELHHIDPEEGREPPRIPTASASRRSPSSAWCGRHSQSSTDRTGSKQRRPSFRRRRSPILMAKLYGSLIARAGHRSRKCGVWDIARHDREGLSAVYSVCNGREAVMRGECMSTTRRESRRIHPLNRLRDTLQHPRSDPMPARSAMARLRSTEP
jgi:hypothetical protein